MQQRLVEIVGHPDIVRVNGPCAHRPSAKFLARDYECGSRNS
jgi:hypothetical protein